MRDIVARLFRHGQLEDLTVKRVRKAAEEELDLPVDYLKSNSEWKDRSKDIISEEVVCH